MRRACVCCLNTPSRPGGDSDASSSISIHNVLRYTFVSHLDLPGHHIHNRVQAYGFTASLPTQPTRQPQAAGAALAPPGRVP